MLKILSSRFRGSGRCLQQIARDRGEMADFVNKSRPVYGGLKIVAGARRQIFALEGEGALALTEQASKLSAADLGNAQIFYVARGTADFAASLQGIDTGGFWRAPTVATLLARLRGVLVTATMGTRLYVAGTEGFIGQVLQLAMELGVDPNSVLTEHRGSHVRRVQCVHCKGITENVSCSPVPCSHCGLRLLVRDHYSRRIGAFQGVNIDAEVPGTAPPPEERFP